MQQTMIVSSKNQPATGRAGEGPIVVATPLDAIVQLELRQQIRTVVLAGSYATNHELAAFLGEFYPMVQVQCEL